jgi:4-alpha-glucanotransferase
LHEAAVGPGRGAEENLAGADLNERDGWLIYVIIWAVNASSHPRSLGNWGVGAGFWDISGRWRQAPEATVRAILEAMGAGGEGPPTPALTTVRLDRRLPQVPPGRLVFEDGGDATIDGRLPPDLPPGYHLLEPRQGAPYPVVVSPGRVPVPAEDIWGFSAQLYAARSHSSWGIGDLSDLRRIGSWSASLGAAVVLVNPLHASSPTYPQQPSPYFPGSRCFVNPIYLSIEEVPGAAGRDEVVTAAAEGRELNRRRLIDRDRVWSLKSKSLEAVFSDFSGDPHFDAFQVERGASLDRFATFCALAERHGPTWREWPTEFQHPASAATRQFAASSIGRLRVRYHAWLQWLLDIQLARASSHIDLVQDLAVGVDPDGPDAWVWQDTFAEGMHVGAPPDRFNTKGQDWAFAPLDPWRMQAAGYEPWIESLRAGFRHGSGLRIDHVMGLFRLYWIPAAAAPSEGAYVRYPHHDLLNILALEAHRAGAFVMGEDLGTVEDSVREDLGQRQVMSYRLWCFDERSPSSWPHQALGAMTTHDLPTVAGVISGSDIEAQRRLGLQPNEEASADVRESLLQRTASNDDTPVADVIARAHRDLARAPCALLAATLDDALAVEERPNMPGTVDEWPNWSIALPLPLEEIEGLALPRAIADAFNTGRSQ